MHSDFNFNVYATFDRIHQFLGDADDPEDASALDRGEFAIHHNNLVEGLVELLQHAARHKLVSLDVGDYEHDLEPEEIGVYRDDEDEPAANHTVAIRVPDEYLHGSASVSEAIEAFDLPTVETSADVALATMARLRHDANVEPELQSRLRDAWAQVAERIMPRALPAVQRLDGAGMVRVYDARTKRTYVPATVAESDDGTTIEITILVDAS